jgi:hypothetical protein
VHLKSPKSHLTFQPQIKIKILFLLNDPPYGSDKNYNALRTAVQLQKQDKSIHIFVCLMSDAVVSAIEGQTVKQGAYNIGSMLSEIMSDRAETAGINQKKRMLNTGREGRKNNPADSGVMICVRSLSDIPCFFT